MTENLGVDVPQSSQAVFVRCCPRQFRPDHSLPMSYKLVFFAGKSFSLKTSLQYCGTAIFPTLLRSMISISFLNFFKKNQLIHYIDLYQIVLSHYNTLTLKKQPYPTKTRNLQLCPTALRSLWSTNGQLLSCCKLIAVLLGLALSGVMLQTVSIMNSLDCPE